RGGEREVTARMRIPRRLRGLCLVDTVGHAYVGSAFDKAPDADRDFGLAILTAHQQGRLALARGERRRDERAVIQGRYFVVDDPACLGVRFALSLAARRIRG